MVPHEWQEETVEGTFLGTWNRYRCINCGGIAVDIWFKGTGIPKKVKIEGAPVYLTDDCLESLKIMQTFWEKEGNKKNKKQNINPLYKRGKKK